MLTILCTLAYQDGGTSMESGHGLLSSALVFESYHCMDNRHDLRELEDYRALVSSIDPLGLFSTLCCGGLVAVAVWEQIIFGRATLTELTTIGLLIAFVVKDWWYRAGWNGSGRYRISNLGQWVFDLRCSAH